MSEVSGNGDMNTKMMWSPDKKHVTKLDTLRNKINSKYSVSLGMCSYGTNIRNSRGSIT